MSKKIKKKPPKKRKRIAAIQMASIPNQLRKARTYSITECHISEDWQERGVCDIFILREKPDHNFVMGVYLVDTWCLGLKDTFYNINKCVQKNKVGMHLGKKVVDILDNI